MASSTLAEDFEGLLIESPSGFVERYLTRDSLVDRFAKSAQVSSHIVGGHEIKSTDDATVKAIVGNVEHTVTTRDFDPMHEPLVQRNFYTFKAEVVQVSIDEWRLKSLSMKLSLSVVQKGVEVVSLCN